MTKRGKYIVIEGHDGTGKSTQATLLIDYLKEKGIEAVEVREPGTTLIGEKLRDIIKDGTLPRRPLTNVALFTAARHELWETIDDSLEQGIWVISTRNYYSTIAYQGYGEGVPTSDIIDITATFTSDGYINPDWSTILELNDEVERQKRIDARGPLESPDTFESSGDEFNRRVTEGYSRFAKTAHITTIDASQSIEKVHHDLIAHIEPLLDS